MDIRYTEIDFSVIVMKRDCTLETTLNDNGVANSSA